MHQYNQTKKYFHLYKIPWWTSFTNAAKSESMLYLWQVGLNWTKYPVSFTKMYFRQYMVHSFGIHVAQCQELFEKREALKPAKERRKCPVDPASYFQDMRGEGASKLSGKGLDALNAAAQQKWTEEVLVQCHNCSRRFLPEKLPIHQRSCTAERPARRVSDPVARGPVSDYNAAASAAGNRALSAHDEYDEYASNTAVLGLNQCQSCGRRFNDIAFEKLVFSC